MASRRVLPDTVLLHNYTGENEKGEAQYQTTVLHHCYAPFNEGQSGTSGTGKRPADSATLYIFDRATKAEDEVGAPRTFLPYEKWAALEDKSGYWTLSDKGRDYFQVQGRDEKLVVVSFPHKVNGSPRMWHFEVVGQ